MQIFFPCCINVHIDSTPFTRFHFPTQNVAILHVITHRNHEISFLSFETTNTQCECVLDIIYEFIRKYNVE